MTQIRYEDLRSDRVKQLIKNHASFEVTGLSGRMKSAVTQVENLIESEGLRCRIYTYGRIAAAGASFFGGVTGAVGIASAVGMAAHNIATFRPDYEIAKHPINHRLTVKYKKK
jgi:hypothetical protein